MEGKHTPGSWTYRYHEETNEHIIHQNGSAAYTLVDTFGGSVDPKDAALIAAAPDMYEALEACRSMLEEITSTPHTPWTNEGGALATMRAAILALAKAEGK